ncbi:hypothetical protein [Kushneria phosphatilytica]|uniref:Uncharacterized protein n=1 Tax=Kushneria phosphatilytica TaxID=657387 RepID=A0A1S1NTV1_9GAMM|nr:hypothetical protein [Kushneria phosphatilytica]OHV12989.1 hypothetical protein BH688_03020 [Kushneria phosphatilytica]QEL10859.1 hypothetical protein FY550_06785 [Kushneria phosphatilytica]
MKLMGLGLARLYGIVRDDHITQDIKLEAAKAALSELIEVEIDYRLHQRHDNPGYHPFSPGHGSGKTSSDARPDHVMTAAIRYRAETRWRSMASALLAHLKPRQRAAVLLAAYPSSVELNSPAVASGTGRALTIAQVWERQFAVAYRLGYTAARPFEPWKSAHAMEVAASRGRQALLPLMMRQAELAA